MLECINEEEKEDTKEQSTLIKSDLVYILYNVFMAISLLYL